MKTSVSLATKQRPPSQPPAHPIPRLQGPFEESIFESLQSSHRNTSPTLDSTLRRKQLLQSPVYQRKCSGKWEQRGGENYHPLWKIVAQFSFGIHLLASGLAKSEAESVQILRFHISEFDGFVERTKEDFHLAQEDLAARLDLLTVPLANLDVLGSMLEDEKFRQFLLGCAERMNHVVDRSELSLSDALKDIGKGQTAIDTVHQFLVTLTTQDDSSSAVVFKDIHAEMLRRVALWSTALTELRTQGRTLAEHLVQLSAAVLKIQRKIGSFDRRSRLLIQSPDRILHRKAVSVSLEPPRRIQAQPKPPSLPPGEQAPLNSAPEIVHHNTAKHSYSLSPNTPNNTPIPDSQSTAGSSTKAAKQDNITEVVLELSSTTNNTPAVSSPLSTATTKKSSITTTSSSKKPNSNKIKSKRLGTPDPNMHKLTRLSGKVATLFRKLKPPRSEQRSRSQLNPSRSSYCEPERCKTTSGASQAMSQNLISIHSMSNSEPRLPLPSRFSSMLVREKKTFINILSSMDSDSTLTALPSTPESMSSHSK
ncbi:hypothetical protein FQN57_002114 [Myotisia sp. PD_48]|nr:hypothetical protein FQN57_002114 [Myotisia sp. PD_48]